MWVEHCAPVFVLTFYLCFNCTSSLKANYFNSKISLWEPFLEKISICLSYNVIEKEEKPIQNIIIVLSDLNVNLSDEFVNFLLK